MKQFGANPLYAGSNNIFIADIHGEGDKLESLIKNLRNELPDLAKYRLVFLGDIIGKGQQTIKTLQIMKDLQKEFEVIIIKGNWEDKFFPNFEERIRKFKRNSTIDYTIDFKKYSFLNEFHQKGFVTIDLVMDYWNEQSFDSVFSDMKLYFETPEILATHAPLTNEFLTKMVENKRTLDQHELTLTNKFVENESEKLTILQDKLFICGHQNCAIKDTVRKIPSVYENKIFLDCGGAGTTLNIPIFAYIQNKSTFIHS